MNFLVAGLSLLSLPYIYNRRISKEERNKLEVISIIFNNYHFIDNKTDIKNISEDYACVIHRTLQPQEIVDPEMGVKFKGVTAINRKIEITEYIDKSRHNDIRVKYRELSNEEIKDLSFGKFNSNRLEIVGKDIFIKNLRFKNNFFIENYKKISSADCYSTYLISNFKDEKGDYKLIENKNNCSNFLLNYHIDYNSFGNNIFLQTKRYKITKGDLKIEYLAYKPIDFLLIGCIKKRKFLGSSNKNYTKNDYSEDIFKKIIERGSDIRDIIPAYRYGADDYLIFPFSFTDKINKIKQINNFFRCEINRLKDSTIIKLIKLLCKIIGIPLTFIGLISIIDEKIGP